MHLVPQLIKSAGTKNHQGSSGHLAHIAELMWHIAGNHDQRTCFRREAFLTCLHFVSSFKDVIELFVPIMHVPRDTVSRHRGHFTDAIGALRLAATDADGGAALRPVLQRW